MIRKFLRLFLISAAVSACCLSHGGNLALASNDASFGLSFEPSTSSFAFNAISNTTKEFAGANGSQRMVESCEDGLPGLASGKCGMDNRGFSTLSNTLADCSVTPEVTCISSLEIFHSDSWNSASYLGPVSDTPVRSERPLPRWNTFTDLDIGPSNYAAVYFLPGSSAEQGLWIVNVDYRFSSLDIPSPDKRSYNVSISPVQRMPLDTCRGSKTFFYINERECYQTRDLPASFRTRLKLDLRYRPRGWISTYLQEPKAKLSVQSLNHGRHELSVEGRSTRIPSASLTIRYSNVENRERLCSTFPSRSGFCDPANKMSWGIPYNSLGGQGIPRKKLFEEFTKFVELFPEMDKATAEKQLWVFSLSTSADQGNEKCSQKEGIYGLSGGNSMVMSDEVPIWNKKLNALEFAVAAPHFRPNGEVAQGFYEMQLDQQVANCLWGTKVTPMNVSLSVLDEQGEQKVASSQISVRDGVVLFRATGFTYSSTKLRASLKRGSRATDLICIKQKVSKIQPRGSMKCPKGWRKK